MLGKRIAGVLLSLAMAVSAAPCFAEGVTDTAAMEKALTTVKSRISVPSELTEFSSNSYDYDGAARYSFRWTDTEGDKRLSVDCNGNGQILSYDLYENNIERGQKLPSIGKETASEAAEAFLKKSAPETVADENDRLVFDKASGGDYDLWTISFNRMKNGIPVSGNSASITVSDDENGEIYVSHAYINFSYGAKFEAESEKIENPEAKYEETYPAEMIYRKKIDYAVYRNTGDYETQLVYRIKDGMPGYISAYSGEVVTKEYEDYNLRNTSESMATEDSAAGSVEGGMLSKQEIAELETIAGLYTTEEAEKFLKNIPQLKIGEGYTASDSGIYTVLSGTGADAKKEYVLRLNMSEPQTDKEKDYRNISARFDAERGRLTYYSNNAYSGYDPDREKLSAPELDTANRDIFNFLRAALPDKITEFETVPDDDAEYTNSVYITSRRIVNGVPYIADSIRVTYDTNENKIIYYNLSYDDDAEFASPDGALNSSDAYGYMKSLAAIKEYYIYSGGEYRLVYGMDGSPMIDAFTGEDVFKDKNTDFAKIEYGDISGHWCEEPVKALADYGIGLAGENFKPDSGITQAELLRLYVSGIVGKYYMYNSDEEIYEYCFRNKILSKEDRNDTALVPREQAFVYMVRFAGYDKVAALSDIYKVSYSDGDKLSDGLIGYAAILSGMGIVAGDGGQLRPKDNTTRAEAAVMLYRYMK